MRFCKPIDREVFALAIPNIVSNLSTPLLGLVDTAVVGHLSDSSMLAGVALGTAAFNFIFFIFIFLRKGTTGLTAQALGRNDFGEVRTSAARSVALGALLGSVLLALYVPIRSGMFLWLKAPDPSTALEANIYFDARIVGAPAALANFSVQGWLLGMQKSTDVLAQQLFLNLSNIVFCILFALPLGGWGLGLEVHGVGLATAVANYATLLLGLVQIVRVSSSLPGNWRWRDIFHPARVVQLFSVNAAIFLRSLCITSVMTSFNSFACKYGDTVLAADNLLLQMQSILSFGTDGFSNAAEALVGNAIGARDLVALRLAVKSSTLWAVVLAICFTLVYGVFGMQILALLTSHEEVQVAGARYLPWLIAAPIISVWSFLLDGFFVGATLAAEMRNTMFFSSVCFFVAVLVCESLLDLGNHGLWAAFYFFMAMRAISMSLLYRRVERLAAMQVDPAPIESGDVSLIET